MNVEPPDFHLIERLGGAASGLIVSLVFVIPKTRTEFAQRGVIALICGVVFPMPLLEWLEFSLTSENIIAASCAAAAVSWSVISALHAASRRFGNGKNGK